MTDTTEPDVDILPCPFCGEMPRSHLFHGDYGGMQIDCITPNCPASPITTGNSMSDPLIAFNAWNRRAAIVGLKAIPGASILGAHDGTMPDAVYDAISEPADAGETIRQLRAENQRLREALTGIKRAGGARMLSYGDEHSYYYYTAHAALDAAMKGETP